jgi:hypothetical protein
VRYTNEGIAVCLEPSCRQKATAYIDLKLVGGKWQWSLTQRFFFFVL